MKEKIEKKNQSVSSKSQQLWTWCISRLYTHFVVHCNPTQYPILLPAFCLNLRTWSFPKIFPNYLICCPFFTISTRAEMSIIAHKTFSAVRKTFLRQHSLEVNVYFFKIWTFFGTHQSKGIQKLLEKFANFHLSWIFSWQLAGSHFSYYFLNVYLIYQWSWIIWNIY